MNNHLPTPDFWTDRRGLVVMCPECISPAEVWLRGQGSATTFECLDCGTDFNTKDAVLADRTNLKLTSRGEVVVRDTYTYRVAPDQLPTTNTTEGTTMTDNRPNLARTILAAAYNIGTGTKETVDQTLVFLYDTATAAGDDDTANAIAGLHLEWRGDDVTTADLPMHLTDIATMSLDN